MKVINRLPCPKCNSSDNLIQWEDGHTRCFTPGCSNHTTNSNKRVPEPKKNFKPIKGNPISIHARKLTRQTCSKYGVVAYENNIHLPYYDDGKISGYKVINPRVPKKDKYRFYVKGQIVKLLFGNQCVHNKKVIAITSGEFDAMALYQMTHVTGLSLANDNVAEMTIKHNLEWLESFEKIILCIDNDTSGDIATDIALSILRPYQTFRMVFPSGYKDANEMLMRSESQLFTRAFWASRPTPSKTIFTQEELFNQLSTHYEVPKGISTGIDKLDTKLGGLRPSELTLVMGKPSSGKSTFARIVLSNLIREQHKCMTFALEEEPIKYNRRLLHSYAGRPLISLKTEERLFLLKQMIENNVVSKLNGITPIDTICHDIEYAYRLNGVQVILVDNIGAGVDKSQLYAQTSDYIGKLFGVAKKFSIHIIAVCHVGREDKRNPQQPGLASGYGSGSLEQQSDNVIIIDKEDESNGLTLRLLKNRELGLPNNSYISLTYDIKTGRYKENDTKQTKQVGTDITRQLSNRTNKSSLKG